MASRTTAEDLKIDLDRLKSEILELACIGRNEEDHGIYRMGFTDADMEARRWLRKKLDAAGITSRVDGAANVFGRWPDGLDTPAVLIGSHLDTVPCGGHLDGSLGVLVGLECARVMREAELDPTHPVEVVAFSDEEGRFGGMFGSQAFAGHITPETLFSARDLNGVLLSDAMQAHGLDPHDALDAHRDLRTLHAFLELHIEQGPVLAGKDRQVGVVENITGLFRWSARLLGRANHAGTTPMDMRHDAFLGLAEFANEIPRVLEENGAENSRATVGNVSLSPGSANTVPGTADFSLDVRDTSPEVLQALHDAFRRALSAIARRRGLMFEFEEVSRIEPVPCHPDVVNLVDEEAARLGLNSLRMPSGAAHDAQILAGMTRVGMIFVPSKEGRSHSPAEWTTWADIEAGANLALHSLIRLTRGG
ncbi:MAG TPA: Zn-dependent hydrolase [Methylomirabilota bacterium]|nr:Zn-dependent hydrolase [Methylomirabilota bacterium]